MNGRFSCSASSRKLRRRLAQRIENHERQRQPAEVRVEFVDFAEHALVFERIWHLLAAAADELRAAHRRHVEREVGDHRENHEAVDLAVATLGHERGQILRVGRVTVEIKIQVNAEMIVAVNNHGGDLV